MMRKFYSLGEKASMMRKFYSAVLFSLFGFLLAVAPIAAQTSATQSTTQIEQRVDSILSRMTLQQKIDMLGGVDDFYIRDFPDLNLPRLKMADGPLRSLSRLAYRGRLYRGDAEPRRKRHY